eukprot:TRINITY_DN15771_c1_g2_i1.p1 TRINITY_DN15771_c1_g2~~TRINITY_DN15771_c1_g2_i1.p1  ORF type:complete len:595 (-),score=93.94 TRINITY_DN15771_c1_g2_i1:89-1873(-)
MKLWAPLICLAVPAAHALGEEINDDFASQLNSCQADKSFLEERVRELEEQLAALQGNRRLRSSLPVIESIAEETPPKEECEEHLAAVGSRKFWKNAIMAFVCVSFAALAAGLTMGLVSIDPMDLEIIVKTEDKDMQEESDKLKLKEDKKSAQLILPLIHNHHRLLVTLLLMNSIANEALPLFLDQIVPSWLAVLMSVSLVLVFGEILPSAIFTGSEQLRIASRFASLVKLFQTLLAPLAIPIALGLDFVLGADHKGRYNFAELRAIVGIHGKLHTSDGKEATFKSHDPDGFGIIFTETPHGFDSQSTVVFCGNESTPAVSEVLREGEVYYVMECRALHGRDNTCCFQLYRDCERRVSDLITFKQGDLTSGCFKLQERDEIKIMHGVMLLTHMEASSSLIPLSKAFMLNTEECVNLEVLKKLDASGHSRIPVYTGNKHNVRGFVLVKKLILLCAEDIGTKTVGDLVLHPLTLAQPNIRMLDLLNKFQDDKCHLALICNNPDAVSEAWRTDSEIPPDVHMSGIITLEDVIEKMIQEDIDDESDRTPGISRNTTSTNVSQTRRTFVTLGKKQSSSLLSPSNTANDLGAPLLPRKIME